MVAPPRSPVLNDLAHVGDVANTPAARRVSNFAIAAVAAALLAACATPAAPPAAVQDGARTWIQLTDAGEARLAYGTPNSDDAPLLMRCRPGSGRITVSADQRRPGEGITLASGGRTLTLQGGEEPDQLNGDGVIVTADAPADAPVFAGFRRCGRMTLVSRRGSVDLPAAGGELAAVERFFAACARR